MATQVRPVDITDSNFEEVVLKAETPVIVDFLAPWCGPCRRMAPVFEEAAGQYAGRVLFAKVNVDDNEKVAGTLGIFGIPTLVVFKNGEEIGRMNMVSKEQLSTSLDSIL